MTRLLTIREPVEIFKTRYPGWRTLFWVIAVAHALPFTLVFFAYHPPPVENAKKLSVIKRVLYLDTVGSSLYALGLVPLLMGPIWGGVGYS